MASAERPPQDELAHHERQLHRASALRSGTVADPALGGLFQEVERRRARRALGGLQRADGPLRRPASDGGVGLDPGTGSAPSRGGTPTGLGAPSPAADAAPGVIGEVVAVGDAVKIFRIGRPSGFSFTAGQYVKAGLPDGRTASFSIASAPHEPFVELCVERIPGGRLTPRMFDLGPGDRIDISPRAKGSFTLDRSADVHLMVATVTGIAPLRSMLRDALHSGTAASFIVLHGASYASELPYVDELAALDASDAAVRYVPTVSRPTENANQSWTGHTGRVDPLAAEVAATLDPRRTKVYACGNEAMIERVRSLLGGRGFRIGAEAYD